jgi:hypothetical protein
MGETQFSLTYGTEAVIPAEVGSPSFRVAYYNPGLNDEKSQVTSGSFAGKKR